LFDIRSRQGQRIREILNREFADTRANSQSLNPIRPEKLVAEKRVDDGWNAS